MIFSSIPAPAKSNFDYIRTCAENKMRRFAVRINKKTKQREFIDTPRLARNVAVRRRVGQ
jgi:hypothetical protein